jgi:pyruvate/2-oxoglutarate dehydrogenase complex dihydrolipoamide dehydrogenase (E3) component
MAVDYDVVIIGGSPAGRYAAIAATQLGATVALVEPSLGLGATTVSPHALSQLGQHVRHLSDTGKFGINSLHAGAGENCGELVQWAEAMRWAEGVFSNLEEQHSPEVLASLGVDFIVGNGQFNSLPHLAFSVNGRFLRARAYLIATGSRTAIPNIEGLQTSGYLTVAEVWQHLNSQKPPTNWVIIGSDPSGCQLAQTLTRLGLNVTLVVRRSHILPQEDPEAAHLVQATLEAEGVRVLTETPVTQVKRIQEKKWIQAGDAAIEADEILLAAGQVSNVESLNLEAVGVKFNRRGVQLNEKLQTTNPRIYACGDVIGGYQFAHIANYEARIALKNALFFPVFKVDYRSIPWAIFSDPVLARVGLTEAQARRRYTHDVVVLRQYFKSVAAAQLRDETTGMCKLIVLRNGEILGATLVGSQAGELIHVIALAISERLKVGALAQMAPVYPTMSEIFDQIGAAWNQQRLTSNTRLQNFLESFFNLRRSWSS